MSSALRFVLFKNDQNFDFQLEQSGMSFLSQSRGIIDAKFVTFLLTLMKKKSYIAEIFKGVMSCCIQIKIIIKTAKVHVRWKWLYFSSVWLTLLSQYVAHNISSSELCIIH